MRLFKSLLAVVASSLGAFAADVRISDLPLTTAPSTNTYFEVADMSVTPRSHKIDVSSLAELLNPLGTVFGSVGTDSEVQFRSPTTGLLTATTNLFMKETVLHNETNFVSNGIEASTFAVGNSSLAPAIFERRGAVLSPTPGTKETFGEPTLWYDSLNPPLLLTGSAHVWKLWWTDGGFQTYGGMAPFLDYAESDDAFHWTRYSGFTGVTNYARNYVLIAGAGQYHLWNNIGDSDIYHWTSANGVTWVGPTLALSAPGITNAFDTNLANVCVYMEPGTTNWYMVYDGYNLGSANGFGVGIAMSDNPGGPWVRAIDYEPVVGIPGRSNTVPIIGVPELGTRGSAQLTKIGAVWYLICLGTPYPMYTSGGVPGARGGIYTPTDLYVYQNADAIPTNRASWRLQANEKLQRPWIARGTADEGVSRWEGQLGDPHMTEKDGISYIIYNACPSGGNDFSFSYPFKLKMVIARTNLAAALNLPQEDTTYLNGNTRIMGQLALGNINHNSGHAPGIAMGGSAPGFAFWNSVAATNTGMWQWVVGPTNLTMYASYNDFSVNNPALMLSRSSATMLETQLFAPRTRLFGAGPYIGLMFDNQWPYSHAYEFRSTATNDDIVGTFGLWDTPATYGTNWIYRVFPNQRVALGIPPYIPGRAAFEIWTRDNAEVLATWNTNAAAAPAAFAFLNSLPTYANLPDATSLTPSLYWYGRNAVGWGPLLSMEPVYDTGTNATMHLKGKAWQLDGQVNFAGPMVVPARTADSLVLNLATNAATYISTNASFAVTFSGVPVEGQNWMLCGTNSNAGAAISVTMPSSITSTGAVTSVSVAANNTFLLSWWQVKGTTWLTTSPSTPGTAVTNMDYGSANNWDMTNAQVRSTLSVNNVVVTNILSVDTLSVGDIVLTNGISSSNLLTGTIVATNGTTSSNILSFSGIFTNSVMVGSTNVTGSLAGKADVSAGGTNLYGAISTKAEITGQTLVTPNIGVATGTSLTMGTTNIIGALAGKENVPDIQKFTNAGTFTWTKPANCTWVRAYLVAGGAGGGSGRKGPITENRFGGGGGAGGSVAIVDCPIASLPATLSVVVGVGGTGGAAQTSNSTDGNDGGVGGGSWIVDTTLGGTNFFGYCAATPAAGLKGTTTTGTGGTAASGQWSASAGGTGASGAGVASSSSYAGSTGGGGGGGLTITSDAAGAGGGAGVNRLMHAAGTAPSGGTSPGGAGNAGLALSDNTHFWLMSSTGTGGGGGAASAVANGGAGGNGGWPGGGGGGGGAGKDGVGNSGAGGAGAAGMVVIVSF